VKDLYYAGKLEYQQHSGVWHLTETVLYFILYSDLLFGHWGRIYIVLVKNGNNILMSWHAARHQNTIRIYNLPPAKIFTMWNSAVRCTLDYNHSWVLLHTQTRSLISEVQRALLFGLV